MSLIYQEESITNKARTPRQLFGNWRRSTEGTMIIAQLLRETLYLCPRCKANLRDTGYEVDHIKPLALLNKDEYHLITNVNNLVVLCPTCNKKKGKKYSTPAYHGDIS